MTRIFLASSNELEADRRAFEIDVARRDQLWSKEGYRLFLTVWEHADDSMSATRKQDDTNATIAGADLFVVLVHTKVGMYTREEFEFAWERFLATGKPKIYTYVKGMPAPGQPDPGPEYHTVREFLQRLAALQHWPTPYVEVAQLLHHFGIQLEFLRNQGELAPKGAPPEPAATYQATLNGSGAIAQGPGAVAVGAGGVHTGGGVYVGGGVRIGRGDFVGRDKIVGGTGGIDPQTE